MSALPKILATRHLPEDADLRLQQNFNASYLEGGLLASAAGMDGLLVTPTDALDAALIRALPDCIRVISTFSVGFEHIDIGAAKARGIAVTNTPDVLTDATAEIAMLLMLGAARRGGEGERMVRAGQWQGWYPTHMMGVQLTGKRLGIVGMGRIGQATAARARSFGMEIHYHNRTRLGAGDEAGALFYPVLEDLLEVSDILSLHCPLNASTRHLLNAERIALLPDGAVVVNTSRGPVVDDDALIAALKRGKLAAAGLDVFDGEPNIHPGYLALENVMLLPHLGSATIETRTAMGMLALDNLEAVLNGQEPPCRVA